MVTWHGQAQEHKAEEEADLVRALALQDAIKANVTAFGKEIQAKLGGMGEQLANTERKRTRQTAALESSVQELSQNVTSQVDATHDLFEHLQNSEAALESAVTADLEQKSKGALAEVDELAAQVSAVQQRSQQWAQEAADKQSAADAQLAASKEELSKMASSITDKAEQTKAQVQRLEQDDEQGMQRLQQAFDDITDKANASRADLRQALREAEDRITAKLETEEEEIHSKVQATKQEGADAREALTGQLNATIATAANMLNAYEAIAAASAVAKAHQPTLLAHKATRPHELTHRVNGEVRGESMQRSNGEVRGLAERERRQQRAEIDIATKQQAARKLAREEQEVDKWRTEQMDSWHEQQEIRRASMEATADDKAALNEKRRENLKQEENRIRQWVADQNQAWRAVQDAEEDGKRALHRAEMAQHGKKEEEHTLSRWVREEDRAWRIVKKAGDERKAAQEAAAALGSRDESRASVTGGGAGARKVVPDAGSETVRKGQHKQKAHVKSAIGMSGRASAHEEAAHIKAEQGTTVAQGEGKRLARIAGPGEQEFNQMTSREAGNAPTSLTAPPVSVSVVPPRVRRSDATTRASARRCLCRMYYS
jgi:hypothetical protein